jgi:hypothetical protein
VKAATVGRGTHVEGAHYQRRTMRGIGFLSWSKVFGATIGELAQLLRRGANRKGATGRQHGLAGGE